MSYIYVTYGLHYGREGVFMSQIVLIVDDDITSLKLAMSIYRKGLQGCHRRERRDDPEIP